MSRSLVVAGRGAASPLAGRRGRMGRRGHGQPLVLWVPALLVLAAMLLPLAYLVLRGAEAGADGLRLLLRPRTLATLTRTAGLALAVTAAATAISLPLAWLTVRTDLPGRRLWSALAVMPLVIPTYVGGFVIVAALGPRGMLQQVLAGPLGVQRLPEIYGFPGAALALTLFTYPYMLLTLRAGLHGLDPALEEASRSLGVGAWATFRRVTLPLLRPSIASGALLVSLYTLSDFGAVSLLQFDSFTRAIYFQYQASLDRSLAALLSLALVALTALVLLVEARSRGRARYYRGSGAVRPAPPVRLGRWRYPALAYCGTVVMVALVLPIVILGFWLAQGLAHGVPVTVVWRAALNSVYAASLAALVTVVAAVPVAVIAVRHRGRAGAVLERLTHAGFALPGIVVALALVFFAANYARPLYQTLGLLVLAYMVRFLPQASGAVRGSLLQVRPSLEEAGRSLGRTPGQVLLSITLPLMRRGVLAGLALVALTTMKELPVTLLLSPIGFKTLATEVWSATAAGSLAEAAAPALLLVLISGASVAMLLRWEGRLDHG